MMSESAEESRGTADLSTLVSGLLSNPEAISKMGEIISKLGSGASENNPPPNADNLKNDEENKTQTDENTPPKEDSSPTFQKSDSNDVLLKLPQMLSKLSSVKPQDSIATKQQIALLLAIRPYLSEHRRELIDTFVKMNHLGAIFKNLT